MPRTIDVTAAVTVNGWTCHVRIGDDGRHLTDHTVTVTKADMARYAPDMTVEDLVSRSFEFLLQREPPTSILRAFDLPEIERYFPDFPNVIRK